MVTAIGADVKLVIQDPRVKSLLPNAEPSHVKTEERALLDKTVATVVDVRKNTLDGHVLNEIHVFQIHVKIVDIVQFEAATPSVNVFHSGQDHFVKLRTRHLIVVILIHAKMKEGAA
ncbi:uncharacterized protein LOC134718841 [Mytilus trossulus]|uniref:uncharacterized protein LOC134718841 n=1 Tax=Mytilus trossulus TaxID=6551 RepID=UPI003004EF77